MSKEIKILKELVKAQDKMILNYRIGRPTISEKVLTAIEKAKKFYGVVSVSEIT